MGYLSVSQIAKRWGVSERTVRNYCSSGRISGAFLTGKTLDVSEDALRPERVNKRHTEPKSLLEFLRFEKDGRISDGIYHKVQVDFTYNSNHMEGSKLTHDQTCCMFETNTIGVSGKGDSGGVNVDDIVETANHFRCIDLVIEHAKRTLSEAFIRELHRALKSGTSDSRKGWFAVGEYKRMPNEVGGMETTSPENVSMRMRALFQRYNMSSKKALDDIL